MAYEFQKLSEVEVLTEVPEGTSVLAEVNGDIKRVPGTGLGGSGIKTAIIKSSDYDDTIANMQGSTVEPKANEEVTFSCVNMTFEEAYQTMASGEPLSVIGMVCNTGCLVLNGFSLFVGNIAPGVPCIIIGLVDDFLVVDIQLFWTADGLSTEQPGGGVE